MSQGRKGEGGTLMMWGRDDEGTNDKIRDLRNVAPVLHYLGEWGVVKDVGIMSAAHTDSKDVGEAALVVFNALQDDEVTLVVDECLGALGWAEDEDVGFIHGSHAVEEAMHWKPVTTSFGLMTWIKWFARIFWMTRHTSWMTSPVM